MRRISFDLETLGILALGAGLAILSLTIFAWTTSNERGGGGGGIRFLASNCHDQSQQCSKEQLDLFSSYAAIFDKFHDESIQQQQLVPKMTLLKTLRFAIEERTEYDPELIAFVRSLIVSPGDKPISRNLKNPNGRDYSQIGQSPYMDNLFAARRDGFFVEAGGYDGESLSNSLFFELHRNWTGILVEAIPTLYQSIVSKRRNIHMLNACLSGKKVLIAKIRVGDVISGRTETMHERHKSRMDQELGRNASYVYVPCFSINTILHAIGVYKVDYFSLDIEGGELEVLRGLDHQKIAYMSFSIEHNGFPEVQAQISSTMTAASYRETKVDGQDSYYLKNSQ